MKQENSHTAAPTPKKTTKIALIAGGVGAVVLIAGYFVVQSQVTESARTDIDNFLRNNNMDRYVQYRDIDASLFGQSVTLHNVRLDFGETQGTIEAINISNYDVDERSGHLNSIDILLEGTDFPINPGRASFFQRRSAPPPYLIGVDAVRGDFGMEYEYDNVSGTLDADINFSLPDLMEGELTIGIGNLHLPPIDRLASRKFAKMSSVLRDASTADLKAISLSLTDLGLENKVAEYLSVKEGMALDAEAYRDHIVDVLEKNIEETPPGTPFEEHLADIAKSATGSSGGTLSVSYEPEYPTTFEDMGAAAFGLMFGGFGALGKGFYQNSEILNDLYDRDVLKIEFDS